eukprot:COSAG01_NODE_771_length_13718_cov_54.441442_2_plen_44_part_00
MPYRVKDAAAWMWVSTLGTLLKSARFSLISSASYLAHHADARV